MTTLNPLAGYKITANTPGHVEVSRDGIHVKTFRSFAEAGTYCDTMNNRTVEKMFDKNIHSLTPDERDELRWQICNKLTFYCLTLDDDQWEQVKAFIDAEQRSLTNCILFTNYFQEKTQIVFFSQALIEWKNRAWTNKAVTEILNQAKPLVVA